MPELRQESSTLIWTLRSLSQLVSELFIHSRVSALSGTSNCFRIVRWIAPARATRQQRPQHHNEMGRRAPANRRAALRVSNPPKHALPRFTSGKRPRGKTARQNGLGLTYGVHSAELRGQDVFHVAVETQEDLHRVDLHFDGAGQVHHLRDVKEQSTQFRLSHKSFCQPFSNPLNSTRF